MTAGYVQESELILADGTDIDAPGGAVTLALCGSWQHDGPCPLAPHHNELVQSGGQHTLRTVFACAPGDEALVRDRIREELAAGQPATDNRWQLVRSESAELTEDEALLAARIDGMVALGGGVVTDNAVTDSDIALLRQAIAVSEQAKARGDHPFGALLTDASGALLLTAQNSVVTDWDVTGHAETNLVRAAFGRFTSTELAGCSLYTSCEPCAMCAGAIYWSGIGRVVFALSERSLRAIAGSRPGEPTMDLPCRTVFAAGRRPTTVVGPAMEDEAAVPHHGFWH